VSRSQWSPVLVLTAVLSCLSARADQGRNFAGFYELSDPVDMGSEVAVTFTAEVVNFSGADVYGATLTLADPIFREEAWGSFHIAYLADRDRARISGEVVIPTHELERWKEGATPYLFIEYEIAAGERFESIVELAPMPLGEEGQ
jgi:hypothetical protein